MQTAKQLSVSLVNKPGRLADVLMALSKGKVNLRALAVMDSRERGTIRFVPDDPDAAAAVLDKINVRFEGTDVLLIEIPTQPNGFRHVCERLATQHLKIDYAYHSDNTGKAKLGALAVVKVNDLAKAQRVLTINGNARKKMPFRRPVLTR
jgi:hypothetical protein